MNPIASSADAAAQAGDDDAIIQRLLGDEDRFFDTFWRRKPFHAPGAAPELAGSYQVEDFLADLVEVQPAPYRAVSVREGARAFSVHADAPSLRQAVADGGVAAMKISSLWHGQDAARFAPMRRLFGALCRAAAMLYLSPARSEDVDLFLAGPNSSLGVHFDTTDVFTVQLAGERRWLVESRCDVERVLRETQAPDWSPAKEIACQGSPCEIVLRPGDALYVPAYAVHAVTGVSWSVSLSLGLRAFNEVDFVEHLVERLRRQSYLSFPPLACAPDSQGEMAVEARLEGMRRVRALLAQIEGAAFAALVTPLSLPPDLSPPAEAGPRGLIPS